MRFILSCTDGQALRDYCHVFAKFALMNSQIYARTLHLCSLVALTSCHSFASILGENMEVAGTCYEVKARLIAKSSASEIG